jgi:hypothetical protein
MNARLARLLVRLYPQRWRERYGAEFEALLLEHSGGVRNGVRGSVTTAANVARSAIYEHVFPTLGGNMDRDPRSFGSVVRHPSAFLPLAMSLIALGMLGCVLGSEVIQHGGVVREADEGTVAHLWQILMAGQMPVIAFFAVKWLPRAPRPSLGVLALQAGAALASMAPVFFLNL